jgi:hypothetical protein
MTWGDESWQQAARDYQAGRKHGRHEGTIQMELGREVPQAEIIPLRVCPETSVRITKFSEHEPD